MFAVVLAGLLAAGPTTVSLPSPHGGSTLSLPVPAGFRVVLRSPGKLNMKNGSAEIRVHWDFGVITPSLARAMNAYADQARKTHVLVGEAAIGSYRGFIYRQPITAEGVDLHCPLVSGHDRLAISYWNMSMPVSGSAPAVTMFRQLLHAASLH